MTRYLNDRSFTLATVKNDKRDGPILKRFKRHVEENGDVWFEEFEHEVEGGVTQADMSFELAFSGREKTAK